MMKRTPGLKPSCKTPARPPCPRSSHSAAILPTGLASLCRRDRRIAESLAIGNRTSDVAQRFDVSAGRVSQLRRELSESWKTFVGDAPATDADPPTG